MSASFENSRSEMPVFRNRATTRARSLEEYVLCLPMAFRECLEKQKSRIRKRRCRENEKCESRALALAQACSHDLAIESTGGRTGGSRSEQLLQMYSEDPQSPLRHKLDFKWHCLKLAGSTLL